MDTLIPVVIILGIVCFFGYKHRDKISALYDRIQNDGLDDEPEVGTTVPEVGTPYKVEPAVVNVAAKYDGVGDPPSQEAWTDWRNRQPASTRFAIPEVWKPTPVDNPDFGPHDPAKESATFGTNGTKRFKLSTRFIKIPIPHPKGIKAKLKVSVVESLETTKGTKYTVEIAGDNVAPNHYEWEWHGGTINTVIEGDSHEIRIKANQPSECFVRYGWTKA